MPGSWSTRFYPTRSIPRRSVRDPSSCLTHPTHIHGKPSNLNWTWQHKESGLFSITDFLNQKKKTWVYKFLTMLS